MYVLLSVSTIGYPEYLPMCISVVEDMGVRLRSTCCSWSKHFGLNCNRILAAYAHSRTNCQVLKLTSTLHQYDIENSIYVHTCYHARTLFEKLCGYMTGYANCFVVFSNHRKKYFAPTSAYVPAVPVILNGPSITY